MKLVVFDLDGTLVDVRGLEAWMLGERTDYDLYHELCMHRKPIYPMLDEWRLWEDVKSVDQVIVTGRGVQYSQQTFQWLSRYQIYAKSVKFRGYRDSRPGVDVKRDIFKYFLDDLGYEIQMAYEDDPDIYEMMVNEFAIPTILVPGFPSREKVL